VTPLGQALLGDLRQFFELLDELGKTAPLRDPRSGGAA
jgi:hypothetical protein